MIKHSAILNISKKFIKDGHLKNKNVSHNPNYFLSSWAESIGYLNLKSFSKQRVSYISKCIVILKEVLSIKRETISYLQRKKINKYNNIILSYFVPENLKKDGSYFDKYFSVNTDFDKKNLWILIPLKEDNNDYKTNENLIILKRGNNNFYYNILFSSYKYLKIFFSTFFFTKIEKLNFEESEYCKSLYTTIRPIIDNSKNKKFFLPYEAQPHQHFLIKKFKKDNLKFKVFGYMHTVLPPLPLDYIKRSGHPDLVYVNGYSQKKIMCKKLGWKNNEVKNIISFRYKKNIKKRLNNRIFLPYYLENEGKIFNSFTNLVYSKPKGYFPKLNIKNHPNMNFSKKHLKLINKLRLFLKKEKKLFKNRISNKKISIFIGSTASVCESLERGLRTFHICSDPVFEKFDKFYWDKIKCFEISKNIFEYKLLEKGNIIKLGKSKKLSIN